MEFLYLDDKICVCQKPAGVLSTDEAGGMPDLVRSALGDPGAPLYTVHRLDRVVGGVFLLARTRHAARDLSEGIRAGAFGKEYLAVACGTLPDRSGELRDYLLRDRAARRTVLGEDADPNAREAVLHYETLEVKDGLSLLSVRLETGRTHQIRAQFSLRSHPLAGDTKYGAPPAPFGVALWSRRLTFPHPKTGEVLTFSALPHGAPWDRFSTLF